MTRHRLIFALLAGVALVSFSGAVQAQLLLDQAIGGSVGGGTELGAAAQPPVDQETIIQRLQQQGYSGISALPSNPHQFMATTPEGMAVVITTEARTGQILSAAPQ